MMLALCLVCLCLTELAVTTKQRVIQMFDEHIHTHRYASTHSHMHAHTHTHMNAGT